MNLETIATHAGYDTKTAAGAMSAPLYMSTAFDFGNTQTAANRFALKELGPIYSRLTNPTLDVLEARFAAFEGGRAAISTSSGMAAIFYSIINLAECGDNIIVSNKIYASALLTRTMKRFGIVARIFDPDNPSEIENLIDEKTKAIFFESLSNPQIVIPKIDEIVKIAKKHRIATIVDNTVATPVLFKPFKHGIDVSVHSATKYIGGQGSALGGLISASYELNDLLRDNARYAFYNEPDESYHGLIYAKLPDDFDIYILRARLSLLRDLGATLAPMNAFLLIQGLETLNLRMKKHCENTLKVAEFLASHPKVKSVNYPLLNGNKYNERAKTYLENGASGLLSFDVGDREFATKIINSTKIFSIVVNIGDSKSLITHPASTTHFQLSEDELNAIGIGSGVIRLSVGLEDANDLINDLDQALSAI
ncbi:O-acetylhomoserine aminocarboxypropyltransferase/cysteine synthase family protein [Campylobacter sp. 9BO]|uniref:O-acetylhomoserine aminocarboxypropyltransferase/cysteine synthase family protein n=1 Tax=Campylobacter sp. 9BO TaxID=3424759 RepID=UPI003D3375A6